MAQHACSSLLSLFLIVACVVVLCHHHLPHVGRPPGHGMYHLPSEVLHWVPPSSGTTASVTVPSVPECMHVDLLVPAAAFKLYLDQSLVPCLDAVAVDESLHASSLVQVAGTNPY